MPVIRITTRIRAPIEVCFDLARDIDLHVETAASTQERAVAGVTHGLIELGQEVTWEATHLGVRQRLTSRITQFDRPRHFRDSMVRGAFRRFDHDHIFEQENDVTVMTDIFDYTVPLGPFGRFFDRAILRNHLTRFLSVRCELIRMAAEQVK